MHALLQPLHVVQDQNARNCMKNPCLDMPQRKEVPPRATLLPDLARCIVQVNSISSNLMALVLFDLLDPKRKTAHAGACSSDPAAALLDAAFQAFNSYAKTMETQHAAVISSVGSQLTTYGLGAGGNGAIPRPQMAPLIAMSLFA